ncbi:hypothetical protein BC826DRAFT_1114079 [Russula brevipes]|nr:hypothetical protein BC826DRAFT_1114079 [Russula brevipes]
MGPTTAQPHYQQAHCIIHSYSPRTSHPPASTLPPPPAFFNAALLASQFVKDGQTHQQALTHRPLLDARRTSFSTTPPHSVANARPPSHAPQPQTGRDVLPHPLQLRGVQQRLLIQPHPTPISQAPTSYLPLACNREVSNNARPHQRLNAAASLHSSMLPLPASDFLKASQTPGQGQHPYFAHCRTFPSPVPCIPSPVTCCSPPPLACNREVRQRV